MDGPVGAFRRVTQEIEIHFPLGGMNKAGAFTVQKALTSRDISNTRGLHAATKRIRGCSREGMSLFTADPASDFVKRMQTVVFNNRRVTYTIVTDPGTTGPAAEFANASPAGKSSAVVRTDLRGDVYWLDGDSGWVKTNAYGTVLWQQPIELPNVGNQHTLKVTSLWVDEDSNVYASTGIYTGTIASNWWSSGTIWKWRLSPDGIGYELQWKLDGMQALIPDLLVYQGILYTIQTDYSVAAGVRTTSIVWYDDIDDGVPPDPARVASEGHIITILNSGTDTARDIFNVAGQNRDVLGRSLALRTTGGIEFVVAGVSALTATGSVPTAEARFLAKYGADKQLKWKFTDGSGDASYGGAALGTGGIGYGVAVDSTGNIISLGYLGQQAGDGVWLRRIIDQGATASTAASGSWAIQNVFGPVYRFPRFALDAYDNIYAPYHTQTASVGTNRAIRVYDIAGTLKTASIIWGTYITGPFNYVMSTAIPPAAHTPAYRADDPKLSEFVYASALLDGTHPEAFHKRILTAVTASTGSPRVFSTAACIPPDLKAFTASGWVTPTGGTNVFDSTTQYISSAFLLGVFYASDGLNYVKWDPTPSVANPNGVVSTWKPNTSGIMPPRARLVFAWRARIGLARTPDDPHNFYMSAEGSPLDWDLGPVVESVAQAFAGNLTTAGSIPDLPNAFLPYSDDVLIVFCDHSIWKISGNPLRGGEIDCISSTIGASFGKPFCMDPEGRVYFHGSRGGIFTMSPESAPERISTESIDADLDLLDLGDFYVEMAWDDLLQAVHVFVLPYGDGGALVNHWTYERRTGAWTPQRYGTPTNTGVQPTAICVTDGDEDDDRRILMAGEDGYIGCFDRAAKSDRGTAIYSHALIGPLQLSDNRSRVVKLKVTMASDLGSAGLEIFASDVPDVLGKSVWQGEVGPGFNLIRPRAVGRFLFLRFWNAKNGSAWAFESASAVVAPAGRVRV